MTEWTPKIKELVLDFQIRWTADNFDEIEPNEDISSFVGPWNDVDIKDKELIQKATDEMVRQLVLEELKSKRSEWYAAMDFAQNWNLVSEDIFETRVSYGGEIIHTTFSEDIDNAIDNCQNEIDALCEGLEEET